MRTLITNGLIVTADGSYAADVLIDGETIAAIGAGMAGMAEVDETIDATGKYVPAPPALRSPPSPWKARSTKSPTNWAWTR